MLTRSEKRGILVVLFGGEEGSCKGGMSRVIVEICGYQGDDAVIFGLWAFVNQMMAASAASSFAL
jgi:hypothetical protein